MECIMESILKERGIKKGFVARKAGISLTTMTLLSKGKSLPTLPVAFRIAEVLEMRIEEIWIKKN
ncbi:transcriptional regulator [Fictibacillus aquaticus]|uniref:Transcriptional regulator n=1 Tax=Fictibacillus aquaticus TaxID=2021314 RepID=A0A235FEM6_9BACL|nr:helix-turn-helix domain-containing protein [Fictibacillus aquaticus]OYD59781.1 transcriptional regulator [Fictibacillus aquaticus]